MAGSRTCYACFSSARFAPLPVDYYLHLNGEQAGPYSESDVMTFVASGQVDKTALAWREGMAEWQPIEAVITLGHPPVRTPTPASQAVAEAPATTAFSCAAYRKYFVIAGAVVVACIVAFFASPYWAVHKLKKAGESQDAVYITDSVDFPAFRESLKGALQAQMAKEASSQEGDGLGALGAAFGAMMIGPMVDAFVTPEALIALMQGKDFKELQAQSDAQGEVPEPTAGKNGDVSTSMGYETLNRFVVSQSDKDKRAASLVFQRHGLFTWKLSGIRLQTE